MAETVLNQEEQNMDVNKKNRKLKQGRGFFHLNNPVLGIVVLLVVIGVTAYVLKLQHDNTQIFAQSSDLALSAGGAQAANYRSYVQQYKDTRAQLEETTRKLEAVTSQLNNVTVQLDTTKGMLAQTQAMLAQTQLENAKLKEDLQSLDGLRSSENVQNTSNLEARISALKAKNAQTDIELSDLKTQLRTFQADFSTLEQGRSLIRLFQNKIRLVKNRMRYLEREAYLAKVAAQKERDRIATLNGNSGFVFRNGEFQKPRGTNKNFFIDVRMVQ
ncbi:MAG: hypothetical protein HY209_04470 [Candidatus Omnitrophica bacterium]|nr:hypothetical protein [Candidatus Omnitrophota bacterium]